MNRDGLDSDHPSHARLPVFYATTALMAAGYGVMFTVLDDFRDTYGISETALGVVVAAGFFTSFAAQILFAPMADRGHERRLLMVGVALVVVGTIGMAFGQTVVELLLSRVAMGLGAGTALPAVRRIVILSDPDHVGRNLGRLVSVDVTGFAAGPVVSAITVGPLGLKAPFLLMAAALAMLAPFLADVRIEKSAAPPQERFAVDLLRVRPVAGAIVIGLAIYLMIGTFDALWVIVLKDLSAPGWMGNLGITVFAVPMILLAPFGGRLAQRRGPFRVATFGLVVGAGCVALYGALPAAWMLLAVGAVHAINDGLTVTGTGVAVAMVAPPERTAAAQGLLGGMQTLVGGLSAMAAGWTYEHTDRFTTYGAAAALMLVLIAVGGRLAGPAWHLRPEENVTPGPASVASTEPEVVRVEPTPA